MSEGLERIRNNIGEKDILNLVFRFNINAQAFGKSYEPSMYYFPK